MGQFVLAQRHGKEGPWAGGVSGKSIGFAGGMICPIRLPSPEWNLPTGPLAQVTEVTAAKHLARPRHLISNRCDYVYGSRKIYPVSSGRWAHLPHW